MGQGQGLVVCKVSRLFDAIKLAHVGALGFGGPQESLDYLRLKYWNITMEQVSLYRRIIKVI
jgi:hypothetical protein